MLAAVLMRHSRRACAGRCVGLTGKKTPLAPLTKCTWFETAPSASCGTPQHSRIQRIPVPPWRCRHCSAPCAAGRTPTAPCPALGSAPALPLPTQGLRPAALHQAVEEEGSAWHDVCTGCVHASAGHRLCLGQCVGECLYGCILLVWAVWLCPMTHTWCEGGG